MKIILSPARRIQTVANLPGSLPLFPQETAHLLSRLQAYTPWELESLLKVNAKIAYSAFLDFQRLDLETGGSPALFAYDGLVYRNIDPRPLPPAALDYASENLRILSAFHGMLRPLDLIQPYRLEMRTRLPGQGSSLYDFWNDQLYRALYRSSDCVVNLASQEYANCIRPHLKPSDRWIDIAFLNTVKGKRQIPTTLAKMARGRMVQEILLRQTTQPEELTAFAWNGFVFVKALSTPSRYVFCGG